MLLRVMTLVVCTSALLLGRTARAQRQAVGVGARTRAAESDSRTASRERATPSPPGAAVVGEIVAAPRRDAPTWAPAASLVLPGSGQLLMRQPRGVAYLLADAYALLQYTEFSREARRRREQFHRTAREVSRARLGGSDDGPWKFYEDMSEFPESGRFSLTTGPGVTPETDESTFNGRQWLDVRSLYFLDPENPPPRDDPRYRQALAEYGDRAWHDGFLWSWQDQLGQWDVYKSAIARENQATRDAYATLGVIAANHLLSAIDALATLRLRRFGGPRAENRLEVTVPWGRTSNASRRPR